MFESPALNLLTGAFIAGIVGVVTAFVVQLMKNASRRRTVARAIFTEMIQALNYMTAGVEYIDGYIDEVARFRDAKLSTLPPEIVRMMRPLDRKILPAMGEAVGYLSPDALISAVAFEGIMESESRRMGEQKFGTPGSRISVQELRNRICGALALVADTAEVVAGDTYRWRQNMHEANRRIIDQARQLANTAEPMPGADKST